MNEPGVLACLAEMCLVLWFVGRELSSGRVFVLSKNTHPHAQQQHKRHHHRAPPVPAPQHQQESVLGSIPANDGHVKLLLLLLFFVVFFFYFFLLLLLLLPPQTENGRGLDPCKRCWYCCLLGPPSTNLEWSLVEKSRDKTLPTDSTDVTPLHHSWKGASQAGSLVGPEYNTLRRNWSIGCNKQIGNQTGVRIARKHAHLD